MIIIQTEAGAIVTDLSSRGRGLSCLVSRQKDEGEK